jgi:parvulin-like peptidyl-prolyl isomerase
LSRRARTVPVRTYPWAHMDPERRNAILLISGIALIVVAAFTMASYGYYKDKIQPKHETVLLVGNRKFDISELQRRVKAETIRNSLDPAKVDENIKNTLAKMEEEELIRQSARRNGVTATSDDMLNGFKVRLGVGGEIPREQLANLVRLDLQNSGLELDDLNDIVRAQVLDKKMNDKVKAALPPSAEQVNLGLIEVPGEGKALQVRQRIDSGNETFSVVAAKESTHPSKDKAGDLGWVPRGALPPEVEKAAFEGFGLSDVIATDSGFFILAIRDKQVRELTDEARDQIAQEARAEVLERTRANVGIDVQLTNGQLRRIAIALGSNNVPGQPGA